MGTVAIAEPPDLSIVVASFSGEYALARCLSSLVPQAAGAEVIAVTTIGADALLPLQAGFPAVRFARFPVDFSVFRLRSLGIGLARGRLIALLEDHCTVAPRWLEAIRAAHDAGCEFIGGPVDHGAGHAIRDWALYFCEYSSLMPPAPDRSAQALSGVNAAYTREALRRCRSVWEEAFYENEVHQALSALGYRPSLVEKAWVSSDLTLSLRAAMAHFYTGGRRFGRYRRTQGASPLHGFWVLGAPALPLILLSRIARSVVGRRPGRLGLLLRSLPYALCLLSAWSAGEVMGDRHAAPMLEIAGQPRGA